MDSIVGKVMRPFAAVWRVIALTLVICATGGAWAVSATAYTGTLEPWDYTTVYAWGNESNATFHNGKVIPINADGTDGTAMKNWNYFCSTRTSDGYTDPAPALYFRDAQSVTSSNFDFFPLTLGGLYVDSLGENDAIYTFTGDASNRSTEFGYGTAATYFKFNKSLTVNRGGETSFIGTATVEVADGATFTAAKSGVQANVGNNSTLILTGGATGLLAVPGGLAVNGTLDISAATRPTISGNVTLSAGSTLVLPAGTAKNSTVSISVCSGTLTVGGTVNVKIGTDDAVSADLVVSGGTITKILTARTYTAAVSGATNFSAISWALGGEASDAVWGVTASAEVTVGSASTITIDNAATMASLKLLGSADLTIATSSQLTLAALNLSEYTGSVTISGTSFTLANGGLTGAATFILDPGTGNTYTMSQSNTGYTGEAVVKSGTVKMGNATSFGNLGRASSIRVKGSATLDENLANAKSQSYSIDSNKVVLEEGAVLTSSTANLYNGDPDNKYPPISRLKLEGNAEIVANDADVSIAIPYNYSYMHLDLGAYTLVKTGTHDFFISYPEISGTGVLDIRSGTLTVYPAYYGERNATFADGTLKLASGTEFGMINYNGNNSPNFTVKNLELNGSITRESENSVLTVTGYISGTGTTPMLTLANGATLKPQSTTGGLTVTESLTLSGAINVDLSEVNLSSEVDGTYFPILTAPAASAFDTTGIGLTRGANSTGWVLYSRETAESGIYELGVYLTPDVTWSGTSGTWTDTSFNGGSGNYTSGQQVVFSDNGTSTDALAVTIDGAKNVSALDFTADNRNVTLSGDAITAGTVSKSGDGVATVNSALSVTTSIAVSDGVLVVNPTAAVVLDEWTASDNGTLVVYVDSGVTTTISAAITANKLVKRGAGTLVLSAANTISGSITVSEGTLKASSNVGCFGGESIPVYVEDGGAVDMNNIRFLNRVYIIGDGPDGNGAYINTGDSTKQNGAHAGGMQGNISNKLTLTGDASIGGDSTIHFGSSSSINVGTYTLTKKGVFWLPLNGTTISGTGKIVIAQGDFSNNNNANDLHGIDLEITGGTLDMAAGTSMSVKNFKCATTITANATASNSAKLIVNGKIEANGTLTIPKLQLNDGASIELATTESKVVVSSALTLPVSGKVTVDVSGITIADNASTILLTVDSGMNINAFSQFGKESTHMLDRSGQTLSLVPIAATVTTSTGITPYATLDAAIGGLYVYKTSNPDAYITLVNATSSDLTIDAETLAEYGIVYDESDGTYGFAAAQISTTQYTTVAKAIAGAADSGDTITLLRDCTTENLSLAGKSVTFDEDEYTFSGSFTGSGTLILGAPLAAADPARWASGWTGTVELKDITTVVTDFDFADYGNANSTVRANNVLVRMPETGGEYGNVGEINLVGEGLRFGGDPIAGQDFTFSAAISGSGKIRVGTRCQTASPAHTRYIFKGDLSDFAGGVDYNETGWYKATIVFQAENDEIPAGNSGEWGEIIVTENATVPLGGEMYGPAGIIVEGSINVLSGGSVRVDSNSGQKVQGSGKIAYATFPASAPTFNNSWAGEVHLPANASISGTNFGNWGKSGSKIVLDGDIAGWIAQNTSVSAEMVLDGHSLTVNDFSPSSYSFGKISGSGNISFNHKENGYQPSSLTIGEIAPTYSGTVNNNTTATLNITTIALAGGSSVAGGTKLLKIGGTGNFSVGSVTVGGETQSGLQLAYVANDGVYVAVATYGGVGYKTLAEAIVDAEAGTGLANIVLLDGYVVPTGYYISNNTVCKYQAARIVLATSATTYYTSLQAALDAEDGVSYIEVLSDGGEATSTGSNFYIKANGHSFTITSSNAGWGNYTPGSTDFGGGIYLYSAATHEATFVWKVGVSSGEWSNKDNWTSEDGTVVAAPNYSLYDVSFSTDATVSLASNVAVGTMEVGGAVTLNLSAAQDAVVTASDIVLTSKSASLILVDQGINKVTLSCTPRTSLGGGAKVVSETVGNTTTYKVVSGTIFSVY